MNKLINKNIIYVYIALESRQKKLNINLTEKYLLTLFHFSNNNY